MTIAVTGATGGLGGRVARELAERGVRQRLIVRDPARAPQLPGADIAVASYQDSEAMARALEARPRCSWCQGMRILTACHCTARRSRVLAWQVSSGLSTHPSWEPHPTRRFLLRVTTATPSRRSARRGSVSPRCATRCTPMSHPGSWVRMGLSGHQPATVGWPGSLAPMWHASPSCCSPGPVTKDRFMTSPDLTRSTCTKPRGS